MVYDGMKFITFSTFLWVFNFSKKLLGKNERKHFSNKNWLKEFEEFE